MERDLYLFPRTASEYRLRKGFNAIWCFCLMLSRFSLILLHVLSIDLVSLQNIKHDHMKKKKNIYDINSIYHILSLPLIKAIRRNNSDS